MLKISEKRFYGIAFVYKGIPHTTRISLQDL